MKKMTLNELSNNKSWKKAVIVFTKDSFNREYSEKSRSYEVSSNDKYFDGNMIGNSLFGNCLDGTDNDVRLDRYIGDWKVDYCYIKE